MATTMPATFRRPRFDRAEKLFLFACLTLTGAFLSVMLWWGSINALPELQIPRQTPLAVNAFDDFAGASQLTLPPPRVTPLDPTHDSRNVPRKDWAKVYPLSRKQAWVASNAPALKVLREGLSHPYQSPVDPKVWMTYSFFRNFHYLSYALRLESEVRAARGDWRGAAQSALDAIHVGFKADGSGRYFRSTGLRQLKSLQAHLDAPTCRAAASQISQWYANRQRYWKTVQQEKLFWQFQLLEELHQRDWAARFLAYNSTGGPDLWNLTALQVHGKGRIYVGFTRYYDERIAAAKLPYATATKVAVPDRFVGDWISRRGGDDAVQRFWFTSSETHATLLMVALALRAYHLEHGVYPARLAQLTQAYLPQIPADPFGNGETLRYRQQGSDFVLWSVGPDTKDNNGQPITQNPGDGYDVDRQNVFGDDAEIRVSVTSQGDWVYGKNR